VFSELGEDVEFSGSLGSLGLISSGFLVAPGGLGSEGSLEVFKVNLVVFEGSGKLLQ